MKYFYTLIILMLVSATLVTCDYEEETRSDGSTPYRLLSVDVTGTVANTNSETYTYNEDGYLTSLAKKDNTGATVSMTWYQYNSRGEVVLETTMQNAVITYTANEYIDGKKSHSETVDQNQIILYQVDYYYDNRGFLTKKEVKDASGVITGTVSLSYENANVRGIGKELSEYTILAQ